MRWWQSLSLRITSVEFYNFRVIGYGDFGALKISINLCQPDSLLVVRETGRSKLSEELRPKFLSQTLVT